MEMNKCKRCSQFHLGSLNVCESCETKDNLEVGAIVDFMNQEEIDFSDISLGNENYKQIIENVGISSINFDRYLDTYLQDQSKYL